MGHLSWRALSGLLLLAAFLSGSLAVPQAHAQFTYSDTSLGYRWGPDFKEPGVDSGHNIAKSIVSVTHSDGWAYGDNFINIDTLLSDNHDPANGSNSGATEIFGVYRGALSGDALTGSQMFQLGPIQDIAIETGGNLSTKNTAFAPSVRAIIFGPRLAFDVPDGFFHIAFHLYKEWNDNGIVGTGVNFDPTWQIEGSWGVPFHVFGVRIKYEGFFDVNGPKGKDGFGNQTVTEFLIHNKLKYDWGNLIFHKEHVVEGGVGLEYWRNKFGNNADVTEGATAVSPFLFVSLYF